MILNSSRWRAAAAMLFGSLALTACDEGRIAAPHLDYPGGEADLRLEISSGLARQGERVTVAVRADRDLGHAVGAFQGRVFFNAARLRYVGQLLDEEAFVLVNAAAAGAGELRLVATDNDGFEGRLASLVFEVVRGSYASGLELAVEELATVNAVQIQATAVPGAVIARDLDALDTRAARHLTVTDWAVRFDDPRDRGTAVEVNLKPGEYRLNLVYGDANLSGGASPVTATDALIVAQVAVGLREIITGSDAPAIDVAVAGNVAPFNSPGLGEIGDAMAPGINADGGRTLTSSDVLVIRQEAVGLNPAVVGDPIPGRGPLATNRVNVAAGLHTTDETWTNDNVYVLQGLVQFAGGATLTIQAGTRIEGVGLQSTQTLSALQIGRDARIQAVGTPLQPIVFTCEGTEPKPKGCWGGVWIAGNATVNEGVSALGTSPAVTGRSAGGCNQRAGEATDPQVLYGGCNDDDNSGTLQYAVIEYAGWTFATDTELNCLTLGAIGRGTTIDHVQCHGGQDDGVEVFGGTVNLKHLYLTANSDDNFDISYGWNGSAQFIVIQQDPNDGDKGLEADNTENSLTYGATPRTNGQIWNVTFLGASTGTGGNSSNDAIHVRRGVGPFLGNWLVMEARVGMDLDDNATCADLNATGGLNLRNSIFASAVNLGNNDSEAAACGPYGAGLEVEEAMINDAANSNTVSSQLASDILHGPYSKVLADFRPRAGQATGGGSPPNNGFLDASATYVGAVAPANSTRSNVPWYSGWTRGWSSATTP